MKDEFRSLAKLLPLYLAASVGATLAAEALVDMASSARVGKTTGADPAVASLAARVTILEGRLAELMRDDEEFHERADLMIAGRRELAKEAP